VLLDSDSYWTAWIAEGVLLKKSPTESVLVDLDLFCVRVLDPSWTRFLPPKAPLLPKWIGPLKRVLPILDHRRGPVERVLLTVFYMFWTCLGPLKVLFCRKSLTRLGLILDSCFNQWKRPPRQISWTVERVLPVFDRLDSFWTAESAVLSKSPTAILDRWECPTINRESYTYTSSFSVDSVCPIESVLYVGSLKVPKCPARLGLVLNRLDSFDRWRSPGERVFSVLVLDRWKHPPCWSIWTAKRVWLKVSFTIGGKTMSSTTRHP